MQRVVNVRGLGETEIVWTGESLESLQDIEIRNLLEEGGLELEELDEHGDWIHANPGRLEDSARVQELLFTELVSESSRVWHERDWTADSLPRIEETIADESDLPVLIHDENPLLNSCFDCPSTGDPRTAPCGDACLRIGDNQHCFECSSKLSVSEHPDGCCTRCKKLLEAASV